MLSGPRCGAFSIVNSFGTSLVGLFKIQEAYSELFSPAAFNLFIFWYRPSPNVSPFIAIIVDVPAVQILTIHLAVINLCFELPLPLIKTLSLYRSLFLRIVILLYQACSSSLFYQVRSQAKFCYISLTLSLRGLMQPFGRSYQPYAICVRLG